MNNKFDQDLIEELKDIEFAKAYGAESIRSELGLALFHARQELKLTQTKVAEKLGFSQSYIAQIENGEINISSDAIGRMLAVLGYKVSFNLEPLEPQGDEQVKPVQFQTHLKFVINAVEAGHAFRAEDVYICRGSFSSPGTVNDPDEVARVSDPRLLQIAPKIEQPKPELVLPA